MTDAKEPDGVPDEYGEFIVPFGRTPDPDSGALVMVVPGAIPHTPQGRSLFAEARALAARHPDVFPLRDEYSVWITYRTMRPLTVDEKDFMVEIVSEALIDAGVIEYASVYGESDYEIDRELGDAYSLEIHDLKKERNV